MDEHYKKTVISFAITRLNDAFISDKGASPVSNELGDWCFKIWGNKINVYNLIAGQGNDGFPLKATLDQEYATFWDDLWVAIQQGKIDRSIRPDREVT